MTKTLLIAAVAALVGAAGALALSDRAPRANATWDSGIAVRGHWKIEVRAPDGALIERREFDNAFVDADNVAARLLAGTASQGWLGIVIGGSTPPCPGNCKILPAGASHTFAADTVFFTLDTTVATRSVTLEGHFIANRDGDVGSVGTLLRTCGPDVAPDTCGVASPASGDGAFTSHSLGSLIPVLEGQQVIAEVELQLAPAQ